MGLNTEAFLHQALLLQLIYSNSPGTWLITPVESTKQSRQVSGTTSDASKTQLRLTRTYLISQWAMAIHVARVVRRRSDITITSIRLSLGKRFEPTALFESDRRQLTFECPAAVIFRDSNDQFVVAWVEMDTGLVVKAERTERVISTV